MVLLKQLKAILIFGILLISVGCASVQPIAQTVNESTVSEPDSFESIENEEEPETHSLDPASLYLLLAGELAGQRGLLGDALAYYAKAAEHSKDYDVTLRAAQIALFNKDIKSAKTMVDMFPPNRTYDLQSLRVALAINLSAGDVPASMEYIHKLVEQSDIPLRNTLLALGDMVSRSSTPASGLRIMDQIVEQYGHEAGAHFARSQWMLKHQNMGQALIDAKSAVSLDQQWPVAHVQWAKVLEYQGKTQDALNVLNDARALTGSTKLTMGYGQLLAKAGQFEQAKKTFSELLKQEPSNAEAQFALALVALKLEDIESAEENFRQLIDDQGYRSQSALYLGRIAYRQNRVKKAKEWFELVEKNDPQGYLEAQKSVALILADEDELPKARELLQQLRTHDSTNTEQLYLIEAELLLNKLEYTALYDLMNQALENEPDNTRYRYTRSIGASEVGQLLVAEKDLKYVLSKEPDNANALNALGYTLASKTSRFKEAREYLEQAIALRPESAAILDSVGWLNYREGAYEKALELLEKAYAKSPDGEIAAHLGETLWALGRQNEARKIWEKAKEREPDNPFLIDISERFK